MENPKGSPSPPIFLLPVSVGKPYRPSGAGSAPGYKHSRLLVPALMGSQKSRSHLKGFKLSFQPLKSTNLRENLGGERAGRQAGGWPDCGW